MRRTRTAKGQLELFPAPPHCGNCDPSLAEEHARVMRTLALPWLTQMLALCSLHEEAHPRAERAHFRYRAALFRAEFERRKAGASRERNRETLKESRARRVSCERCATRIHPGGQGLCRTCAQKAGRLERKK